MAYSSSDFNPPEFREHNPFPYAGGYDISQTYGQPLSPSDAICYPRFPSHPNSPFLNGLTNGSTTLPSGSGSDMVDQTTKPQNGTEPPKPYKEEEEDEVEEKPWYHGSGNWPNGPNSYYWGDDVFSNWNGGSSGNGNGSDYHPWSGYGYGYNRGDEDGYEYGKPVAQPPCGYPPDDMGPCAGLFSGYFPCLSQKDQKKNGFEQGYGNDCKGTAEYLFGSYLYPYGSDERRDERISYGGPNYGYERHYQGQPHHVQIEYNEQSWFQQPSYNEAYKEGGDESISIGGPNYGYERHYQGQPHHVQIEYNEQSQFQQPSYNEAYKEGEYPHSEYGTDSYNDSGEYFYYNQRKYSDYDE